MQKAGGRRGGFATALSVRFDPLFEPFEGLVLGLRRPFFPWSPSDHLLLRARFVVSGLLLLLLRGR